ncbi:MAG: hypothetical protein WBL67_12370 [Nitrososphaeraceae archaeon]
MGITAYALILPGATIDHNPLLYVSPPSARSAVGAGYTPGVVIGAGVPIQCRKCISVRHTSICKECNVYR